LNNFSNLVDALIKDEMEGTPRHELVLFLGKTPELLQAVAGFPDYDLVITGKVIGKVCFDHGIGPSLLKRLPDIINSPKSIFRSANQHQTDSVIVLTYELKGLAPIIMPIRHSQSIGRNGVFNIITSVYGKEGPDPEVKWQKQGLQLWTNPI